MYVQVIIYRHFPRIKTQMVMQFSNYIEIQHVWTSFIAFQQLGKKDAIGLWVAFAVTVALVADLADINIGIVAVVVVVVVVDDGVLIFVVVADVSDGSLWCSHQSDQTDGKCPSSEPPGPQMECSWRENKVARIHMNDPLGKLTWATFKALGRHSIPTDWFIDVIGILISWLFFK